MPTQPANFHSIPALLDDKYQVAIKEFVRKYDLACEELTEQQLASVIRQALACGDIVKHVRIGDNAQAVTYIPYAEFDRLQRRIQFLEDRLKQPDVDDGEEPDEDED